MKSSKSNMDMDMDTYASDRRTYASDRRTYASDRRTKIPVAI